jgi:hypothetical protein
MTARPPRITRGREKSGRDDPRHKCAGYAYGYKKKYAPVISATFPASSLFIVAEQNLSRDRWRDLLDAAGRKFLLVNSITIVASNKLLGFTIHIWVKKAPKQGLGGTPSNLPRNFAE